MKIFLEKVEEIRISTSADCKAAGVMNKLLKPLIFNPTDLVNLAVFQQRVAIFSLAQQILDLVI